MYSTARRRGKKKKNYIYIYIASSPGCNGDHEKHHQKNMTKTVNKSALILLASMRGSHDLSNA